MPLVIDPAAPLHTTARELVLYLASGEMTEAGLHDLRAWLAADPAHRAAFEHERALWQGLEKLRPQPAGNVVTIQRQPPARRRLLAAAGLLAASLLLAFGYAPLHLAMQADYRTAAGEQRQITLADGSRIRLNTASAIAVQYSANERRIDLLQGEALFEVAPETARPFRVVAAEGSAQALGTAFVVRTGEHGASVAVTRGLVGVSSPAGDVALRLGPGQAAQYRSGAAPQPSPAAGAAAALAWLDGTILIHNQPLAAALRELERYGAGPILVAPGSGKAESLVSGNFHTNQLDDAVAALAAIQGLKLTRLGGYLTLLH